MCSYPECRVPAEPGEAECILHLASPKSVERFKEVVYQQIDATGPKGSRNARFRFKGYCFPVGIKIAERSKREASRSVILPRLIEGHVTFLGATIQGSADFSGASIKGDISFSRATIEGVVRFRQAIVKGNADFSDATIKGAADFKQAMLNGFADFSFARIEGQVSFCLAAIKDGANFNAVRIVREADFWSVTIDGDTNFASATFTRETDFTGATFTGDADFSHSTFRRCALFPRATFEALADFRRAKIKGHADFTAVEVNGGASFSDATIDGLAVFHCAIIKGNVHVRGLSAVSIYLGFPGPQIGGCWLGVDRCGLDLTDASHASSFWRFAQHCFSKNGEREAADAAFYFERVWRWKELRKTEAAEGTRSRSLRTFLLRTGYSALWILDCLFLRWTTAYGASIARLFTTWFAVVGGFAAAFSLNPGLIGRAEASVWTLRNWIDGIHYSVTTFATLGLGDLSPGESALGKVLTSVEALLGAVLIALAVLVLGRRFMRQS